MAQWAAETAEAAAAQGKFWEVHDFLFENQGSLEDDSLLDRGAKKLKIDPLQIRREVSEHVHLARVQEDYMSGIHSGVNGTPTFFINGLRYDGYPDFGPLVTSLKNAGKGPR